MYYELHGLKGGKLPFIFHRDTVYPGESKRANWHENPEFLFVIGGEGTMTCDFEPSHVQCGDLFVVNSDCLHSMSSDSSMTYYCLIADTSFCLANGLDPRTITFQRKINDSAAAGLYCAAVTAFSDPSPLRETKVKAAVLNLLLYLAENHQYAPSTPKPRPKMFSSARSAIEYIRAHFTERISVNTIAAYTGYSRAYFSREFKNITGCTVVEYINYERCSYAKKLLSSGKSVSETALAAGFDSPSYFTRTYKRVTGRSPVLDRSRPQE